MQEINWLKDDGVFLPMLNDDVRNKFYHDAINQNCAGKRVIDAGCGTGFLSIIAAKAGAKHVLAVEKDSARSALAKDIIDELGLADRITVVNADFLDVDHKADICVTETIGGFFFEEGIKRIARHANKIGCQLIPNTLEINAVAYEQHPVFDMTAKDHHGQSVFTPGVQGLDDFSNLVNHKIKQAHPAIPMPMGQTNLFYFIKNMPYIRLKQLTSASKIINIADGAETSLILQPPRNHEFFTVVLFFKAMYNDHSLYLKDTIFELPIKRMNNVSNEMRIWYDDEKRNWWIDH